jgi:hypothetical protein
MHPGDAGHPAILIQYSSPDFVFITDHFYPLILLIIRFSSNINIMTKPIIYSNQVARLSLAFFKNILKEISARHAPSANQQQHRLVARQVELLPVHQRF